MHLEFCVCINVLLLYGSLVFNRQKQHWIVINTCCVRERTRQFGSSLNFQKSWWSSENWTNCSNATLILCYSKCKLVSQKLFLITLCRVNLLCGNFPCSLLASHSVMNHDDLYDLCSDSVLLIYQSSTYVINTIQVLFHASLMHSNTVGQGKQMNCIWMLIMFCDGNSNLKYNAGLFLLHYILILIALS